MASAKWATPSTASANFAGSTFNSLASGATSAFVTYDNSTNLDLYAAVLINLGSFTSVAPASITLRAYVVAGGGTPDDVGSVGGGDVYIAPMTTGASAKVITIPLIRLYPFSMRFQITNNAGATFAATGNSLILVPFNEAIN